MLYVIVKKRYGSKKPGMRIIYPNYVAESLQKRKKVKIICQVNIKKLTKKTCSLWETSLDPKECLPMSYLQKLEKLATESL